MTSNKSLSTIYGFESYQIRNVNSQIFIEKGPLNSWNTYIFSRVMWGSVIYLRDNETQIPYLDNLTDYKALYPENKELLNTAQTIYIHPSCKLSRNMVCQKYKKTLNPWLADAVIIPEINAYNVQNNDAAIFISEDSRNIFWVYAGTYEEDVRKLFSNEDAIGKPFRDFLKITESDVSSIANDLPYKPKDLFDAELIYFGETLSVPNKSVLNELIQNAIPKSKIIYEDTIMASLGNDENQLSVESLTSIAEMLNSSDGDTIDSALKALSTMDYMHYPNSVILVLRQNWYNYNRRKVMNSTAVKYMMNHLGGVKRRYIPSMRDNYITQKDYDVFKDLVHSIKIDSLDYVLKNDCPFLYLDSNLKYKARIKD